MHPSPVMAHPGTDHASTPCQHQEVGSRGNFEYDEKGRTPRSFECSILKKHVERGAENRGVRSENKKNTL